jgi:hypothetical protein
MSTKIPYLQQRTDYSKVSVNRYTGFPVKVIALGHANRSG